MSLRKIASLTALLSFMALVFTSVFSYLAPRGPGSSNWEAFGLEKHGWFTVHTNLGVLFLVACIVHTVLNIKPVIAYLRNKDGKFRIFTLNFNIALLLTAWIILSSLFDWPPINAIGNHKENRGNRGRHHAEEVEEQSKPLPAKPPFFYSGRSLDRLSDNYEIDVDEIIQGLENIGIDAQADWSFRQIAAENGMATESVYEAVQQIQ
jgi:hypothetical protein